MSYETALEAAGATVHEFKTFGSYQGDWWALVTHEGVTGWVNGSYGSCSWCDAFEAEFGYGDPVDEDFSLWANHYRHDRAFLDTPENRGKHQEAIAEYKARLAEFGNGYLPPMSQEAAEAVASRNLEWDMDAKGMLDYIRSFADRTRVCS